MVRAQEVLPWGALMTTAICVYKRSCQLYEVSLQLGSHIARGHNKANSLRSHAFQPSLEPMLPT